MPLTPNKNNGVIELERPTDWVMGAETGITYEVVNPSGNWLQDLPTNEKQSAPGFDSLACTNFSWSNAIETQIDFKIRNGQIDLTSYRALADLGFFDANNHFNISDRALAKMSGTGLNGNYMQASADTARHLGLLPEKDWPFTQDMDWNTFYAPIPQALLDKAKKILDILDFSYESVSVSKIGDALKQAPLNFLTPVCPSWNSGTVTSCGLTQSQHATTCYGLDTLYQDLDHYIPYLKTLSLDYHINYVFKTVVSIKKPPVEPPKPHHTFLVNMKLGQRSPEIKALQECLIYLKLLKTGLNTGFYGQNTKNAVSKYQSTHNLVPDGECGPLTRGKLNLDFA